MFSATAGATSSRSRAAGLAGTASTTASAWTCSASPFGPTVRCQPEPAGVSARTVAFRRIVAPLVDAAASTRVLRPPTNVPKNGVPGARGAAACAARTAPTRVCSTRAVRVSAGMVAARERSLARPAYTPPSIGSTNRSTISSPSRPRTSSPTVTSAPGASSGRPVSTSASGVGRATAATAARSPGTPISVPRGSGRSSLSTRSAACPTVGWTMLSASPSRRIRATAADSPPAGSRIRNASAPNSTGAPASSPVCSLPPRDSLRS